MDLSMSDERVVHYKKYIGQPDRYDFMGATQFRLLCSLGLRAHHSVLDFGCGSLRAGRLFICYLNTGCYYGIDPNKWLIDAAIKHQVGEELIRLKKPEFNYNPDFETDCFKKKFDFILAQSIFSHAGSDLIRIALHNFKKSLKQNGLIAATFFEGHQDFDGCGWKYPWCADYNYHPVTKSGSITYRPATIRKLIAEAGLYTRRLPWYHPRQTWYVLANTKSRLPHGTMLRHLSGSVFAPEFCESWKQPERIIFIVKRLMQRSLPLFLSNRLLKTMAGIKR